MACIVIWFVFQNLLWGTCGICVSCRSHHIVPESWRKLPDGVRACWCYSNSSLEEVVNIDSYWATLLIKATWVRHQGDRMRFVIIKSPICSVCHSTFSPETKSFLLVLSPLLSWTMGNSEWVICHDETSEKMSWPWSRFIDRFMLEAQQDGFYCIVLHSTYFYSIYFLFCFLKWLWQRLLFWGIKWIEYLKANRGDIRQEMLRVGLQETSGLKGN